MQMTGKTNAHTVKRLQFGGSRTFTDPRGFTGALECAPTARRTRFLLHVILSGVPQSLPHVILSGASQARSRRISCCFFAVVTALLFCMSLFVPQSAWATYADVATSYPATQEVTASGDVLTAADIPDGSYNITVSTSSYMCKFSNCTLNVHEGAMTATFNISKAYTAVYYGTAEQAAAATDATGTSDSAYYFGSPKTGYTERLMTIPVPALNQLLDIATYNGGTKSHDEAVWYSRQVVFNSSDAIDLAIANAKNPGSGSNSGGENASASSNTSSGESGSSTAAPAGAAAATSDSKSSSSDSSSKSKSSKDDSSSSKSSGSSGSSASASAGGAARSTGTGSYGSGSGGSGTSANNSDSTDGADGAATGGTDSSLTYGTPFSLVQPEDIVPEELKKLVQNDNFDDKLAEFLSQCIMLEVAADIVVVLLLLAVIFLIRARNPRAFAAKARARKQKKGTV